MNSLLQVRGLSKTYQNNKGSVVRKAVSDAQFDLFAGEVFGLLGARNSIS